MDAAYINPKTGLVHRADKDGNIITSSYASGPFDTDISLIYYGEAGMKQDADFETAFSYSFQHYHALYDRHYYYVDNGSFVNNVKVINDAYGTGKAVKLDSDLYASLKKAVGFMEAAEGLFNIGIGNLSTLWDYYIGVAESQADSSYASLSAAQLRYVYADAPASYVSCALMTTPTYQELKSALVFDESSSSVTFQAIPRIDEYAADSANKEVLNLIKAETGEDLSKPSLTLGGFGKGEATELFSDKYSSQYAFLINSGHSSVKCNASKPDKSSWNLSVANPVYYEEAYNSASELSINPADLILSEDGTFDLSTSGYYEHYFYVPLSDGSYVRRSHIIDPSTGYSHEFFSSCSVIGTDSGYADMYTTALMNTDSLSQAQSLLKKLNAYTGENAVPYYLVNYESGEELRVHAYVAKELEGKMSLSHNMYPESFPYASLTDIIVLDE